MHPDTAILVLAAGASTRMGSPKQVLPFGDTTLLGHVLSAALAADCGRVAVVTGAHAAVVSAVAAAVAVPVIFNPDWEQGMGSSIRAGVAALGNDAPGGVLILLADQPCIDAGIIRSFFAAAAMSHGRIVAAAYEGTIGAPVYFPPAFFDELLQLDPEGGAKPLLLRHADMVEALTVKDNPDLDTIDSYRAELLRQGSRNAPGASPDRTGRPAR